MIKENISALTILVLWNSVWHCSLEHGFYKGKAINLLTTETGMELVIDGRVEVTIRCSTNEAVHGTAGVSKQGSWWLWEERSQREQKRQEAAGGAQTELVYIVPSVH